MAQSDPPPDPFAGYYAAAAQKYGVSETLLIEQGRAESGFDPSVVSPGGAIGIAQLEPATAAGLGVNPRDPQASINAQAQLMSGYLSQYGGDVSKALAAYNAGPGAVQQYGGVPPFAETQNYVARVTGAVAADQSTGKKSGGGFWHDVARVGGAVTVGPIVSGVDALGGLVGGAASDAAGSIGDAVKSAVSSEFSSLLTSLRPVLIGAVFVAGGAGLVVLGVKRSVTPEGAGT